jgi:hypothetical protein
MTTKSDAFVQHAATAVADCIISAADRRALIVNTTSDQTYAPGPTPGTVRTEDGKTLTAPEGWVLLKPGDAALTRRVKLAGEHWQVQEKKGRKLFSRGVWAPKATIERIKAELDAERNTASYQKRRAADTVRREKSQADYVDNFFETVVAYLCFHQKHAALAQRLAKAVTDHATPVGSGTVARTQRIPVNERAEAAVLAWMRHHTTDYEGRTIPRIKGKRREVRKTLAKSSKQLLNRYRQGEVLKNGPLEKALIALPSSVTKQV